MRGRKLAKLKPSLTRVSRCDDLRVPAAESALQPTPVSLYF